MHLPFTWRHGDRLLVVSIMSHFDNSYLSQKTSLTVMSDLTPEPTMASSQPTLLFAERLSTAHGSEPLSITEAFRHDWPDLKDSLRDGQFCGQIGEWPFRANLKELEEIERESASSPTTGEAAISRTFRWLKTRIEESPTDGPLVRCTVGWETSEGESQTRECKGYPLYSFQDLLATNFDRDARTLLGRLNIPKAKAKAAIKKCKDSVLDLTLADIEGMGPSARLWGETTLDVSAEYNQSQGLRCRLSIETPRQQVPAFSVDPPEDPSIQDDTWLTSTLHGRWQTIRAPPNSSPGPGDTIHTLDAIDGRGIVQTFQVGQP